MSDDKPYTMSDPKIKVPDGMLKAVISKDDEMYHSHNGYTRDEQERMKLESALLWLSKNPIVPTDEQINKLWESWAVPLDPSAKGLGVYGPSRDQIRFTSVEWQRRMFLAPEPEVPCRRTPESVRMVCLENCPVEKVTEYFITSSGHYLVLVEGGESLRFDKDGYFPPGERGNEVKSRLKFKDEEPEVPEEIKDLLIGQEIDSLELSVSPAVCNVAIIQAFLRGKKAGTQ